MKLKIKRLKPTLALIWCKGGRVRDRRSGLIYSEVETRCEEWQSDEQVLEGYEAVA